MKFPVRVYYEDTDAGGVVYHARYLHFLERARTEWLRQFGFSQHALLTEQLAFVVKKIEIDYKLPARLDDLLTVKTTVYALTTAKIVFEQSLWREECCLNHALVTVACVDLQKMKPTAIPKTLLQVLQAVN